MSSGSRHHRCRLIADRPSRSHRRGSPSVVILPFHAQRFRGEAVERRPEDRLEILGLPINCRDGDDHVEDLLQRQIVSNLPGVPCGEEQRPARFDHAAATLTHDGDFSLCMLEQLGTDRVLADNEGEEPVQPCDKYSTRRRCLQGLRRCAYGIDLIDVERLEEVAGRGNSDTEWPCRLPPGGRPPPSTPQPQGRQKRSGRRAMILERFRSASARFVGGTTSAGVIRPS